MTQKSHLLIDILVKKPKDETMTTIESKCAELKDVRQRLTMLFIGGRRPSDNQMDEVESLRDRESELTADLQNDTSWCKS